MRTAEARARAHRAFARVVTRRELLPDLSFVEVSGSERTTFYPTVQALAKEFRLNIRPDARPEAGHYYRSDHFSLARVGIPAFSVNEGMKYKGHDAAWGMLHAAHTSVFASKPATLCNPKPIAGESRLLDTSYGWDNVNQIKMVVDNLTALPEPPIERRSRSRPRDC